MKKIFSQLLRLYFIPYINNWSFSPETKEVTTYCLVPNWKIWSKTNILYSFYRK